MTPHVNLGQSLFQDTHFVMGAQTTPFRKLRQLELEIRSLESTIRHNTFELRRNLIKISKLDLSDELQLIDHEEFQFKVNEQQNLISDVEARLQNFLTMKNELLKATPKEYWDAGFEASENEHWIQYITKQLTTSQLLGIPDRHAMEQLMLMPQDSQDKIMLNVASSTNGYMLRNQEVLKLASEENSK